jgi:hypothetical protein
MKTTIAIEKETREKLKQLGTKNETYDSIIQKLMEK